MQENIVEIMSSIQGEGILVGYRQVFLRFSGCNLDCEYCDTQHLLKAAQPCIVEQTPGKRDFVEYANPLDVEQINQIIASFDLSTCHSISLTGGEPLLHVDFLQELIPVLKQHGPQIFLETNGTLSAQLDKIIDLVDMVSMDIKLPSVTGLPEMWAEHLRFLQIAQKKQVYIKAVISLNTDVQDITRLCEIILAGGTQVPLILQPVTPTAGVQAPDPRTVLSLMDHALGYLPDVRVIPQTHRMIGQL